MSSARRPSSTSRPAGTSHRAAAVRDAEDFPLYCDYSCDHAEFSDPCAVGACRRDIGVWCTRAQRFHNKHARCLFRR